MRKFISSFIGLSSLFLFLSCKNYKTNLEDFLSYWASEAYILEANINAPLQNDNEGIKCISSTEDTKIIFKLHNPKNFNLIMPGPSEERQVINFINLKNDKPKINEDYEFIQSSNDSLTLNLKKEFLQKIEVNAQDISHTITLYSSDGRKFSRQFSLNMKVNTPPPNIEYKAIGKTEENGKQYYVIVLKANDMDKTIGDFLLHKDINSIVINHQKENSKTIPLTVNASGTDFNIENSGDFLLPADRVQKLDVNDFQELPPSENPIADIPAGKWIIRLKTDIEVKKGAAKEYKIKLCDNNGLSSPEIQVNTSANKLPSVKLYQGETQIQETDFNSPQKIFSENENSILLTAKNEIQTANITGILEKVNGGEFSKQQDISGNYNTNINLQVPAAGEEAFYKITLTANALGYTQSNTSIFYLKVFNGTKQTIINIIDGISAAPESYIENDGKNILNDANNYIENTPLVIYNSTGKAKLKIKSLQNVKYAINSQEGTGNEIVLNNGNENIKKYLITISDTESGEIKNFYIEVKNLIQSYTELKNTVKNSPVTNNPIMINIGNALECPDYENTEIEISENKKILIQNGLPSDMPAIDASGKGRIFKISGDNTQVQIKNLILQKGNATGTEFTEKLGGCVYMTGGSCTIENSTIQKCQAETGGALTITGGICKLINTSVKENKCLSETGGAAATVSSNATLILDNSTVENNINKENEPDIYTLNITGNITLTKNVQIKGFNNIFLAAENSAVNLERGVTCDDHSIGITLPANLWKAGKQILKGNVQNSYNVYKFKLVGFPSGKDWIISNVDGKLEETGVPAPVIKIKQNNRWDTEEEKTISAGIKDHSIEDILSYAEAYKKHTPLVLYNEHGKAKFKINIRQGYNLGYDIYKCENENETKIDWNTDITSSVEISLDNGQENEKKYRISIWAIKSNQSHDSKSFYVELKKCITEYSELKLIVKNAPITDNPIPINIGNGLKCPEYETSEIEISKGKKLIIQNGILTHQMTIDADGKGRIFKITGDNTELKLKDLILTNSNAIDKKGGAVYVESGKLKMAGNIVINSFESTENDNGKNDIYLASGKIITIDESLTGGKKIRITPENYTENIQVLKTEDNAVLEDEVKNFIITPENATEKQFWKINNEGKLQKLNSTINGTDTNSWTKLKTVIDDMPKDGIITINGEINAEAENNNNVTIEIAKNITIKGKTGSTNSKLNANQKDTMFYVSDGMLTLQNMEINNGHNNKFALTASHGGQIKLKNVIVNGVKKIISSNSGDIYLEDVTMNDESEIELGGIDTMQGNSDYKYCSLNLKGNTNINGKIILHFESNADVKRGRIMICDNKAYTLKLTFNAGNNYEYAENQQVVFIDNSAGIELKEAIKNITIEPTGTIKWKIDEQGYLKKKD